MTTNPSHTPGPWCFENIGEKENCIAVGTAWRFDDETFAQVSGHLQTAYDEDGELLYYTEAVCMIEDGSLTAGGDMWSNARLIAAAPDMLAALKAAEQAIEDCHNFRRHHHFDQLKLVQAAIAKAEGRDG